jgi:UDP-glucose 4-epimerase
MKILVTGAKGFIGGYIVEKLLNEGHTVIGVDNLSKYKSVEKSYDNNPNFIFYNEDAKNSELLKNLLDDCDHFIHLASKIGGISYFVEYAYDLMAENERLMASVMDSAIYAFDNCKLKKITILSSSMIYESTDRWPSKEGDEYLIPPPKSCYGYQKLATHYWVKGAYEQYKLPYTLIVPFNVVGLGESKAIGEKEISSGSCKLAMSHVVPDLIQKVLKGQSPLHILGKGNQIRHYTAGEDVAEGLYLSLENSNAINESFNIATPNGHTVMELSKIIWEKINKNKELKFVHDIPFPYDVQKRVPSVIKAKELLGFEAKKSLEDSIDIIIPWIDQQIKYGNI